MKRYLLDAGIMGDFINRRRGVAERARDARTRSTRIGTAMPVLAELFYGIEFSSTRDENMRRLKRGLSEIVIWPLDRPAVEEYGRLAATLRRMGRSIQVIDTMIAAIALSVGNCTIVTKDSDFAAMPGLTIENWAS